MVGIVAPEKIAEVWPQVRAWIVRAIERNQGDENELDVLIALARGQYLLWHEPGKYAAVAQLVTFPRQKVGIVLYCGGSDLEAIRDGFEYAVQWAKAQGIQAVRTFGRPGWERVLGLKRKGVVLQREL